jgi:hypothetical protein
MGYRVLQAQEGKQQDEALPEDKVETTSSSWFNEILV